MMSLAAGTQLGRYEIRSKLGEGGMGAVYLAEDTRLHRKVALKILPSDLAAYKDRMRRFEQEAQAAAALNHPNIAHIYEIGQHDGTSFIAMEFVDGFTLRQLIHGRQTELAKLLRYLQHVAEGLAKAHAAGIVHRDLKPDNIMVTREGHAKILDFGLAKLVEPQSAAGRRGDGLSEVATALMQHHSTPGAVLGTVGYMSPEQAQGRGPEVDHRSDTFSFGCILYEAITGRKAFEGKDAIDSLNKIIREQPAQIATFAPEAPADLQRIVRRCLAKDPEERYQTIKDVAIEIKEVRRELLGYARGDTAAPPFASRATSQPGGETISTQPATAIPSPPPSLSTQPSSAEYIVSGIAKHKAAAAVVLAAGIVAVIAIGYVAYRLTNRKPALISFQSAKFTRMTTNGNARKAAISPDGKWLVHVVDDGGQQSLWLRQVAVANSNTQVVPPANVLYIGLGFSPDGNYVYYNVRSENTAEAGTLYQVPVLGGTSRRVLTGAITGAAFSPDGKRIAFINYVDAESEDRLMIANADGSAARQLAARRGNECFLRTGTNALSWSPDGSNLATPVGVAADNWMTVATVSVETGQVRLFSAKKWEFVTQTLWLKDGQSLLVTAREQASDNFSIWQVFYPSGEVQKITSDLNSYPVISVTADGGVIAAVQTERTANLWVMPAFDSARVTQITQGRRWDGVASWTPDGKLVYATWSGGNYDLNLIDSRGGDAKQLTANSGANSMPFVSPDGRYIVFVSDRAGSPNIWRMDIDGGNPKRLTDRYDRAPYVSPDGQWIAYMNYANNETIWRVPIEGGQPLRITDKFSVTPAISPDGKLIACLILETTKGAQSKLALIPSEGGPPSKLLPLPNGIPNTRLRWLKDGSAVVYGLSRNGVSNLWAQPIDGSPLKQLTNFTSDRIFAFDFSRDWKQIALSRGSLTDDVVLISNFK